MKRDEDIIVGRRALLVSFTGSMSCIDSLTTFVRVAITGITYYALAFTSTALFSPAPWPVSYTHLTLPTILLV